MAKINWIRWIGIFLFIAGLNGLRNPQNREYQIAALVLMVVGAGMSFYPNKKNKKEIKK
jgi:disulfide bond formation protein DsbB